MRCLYEIFEQRLNGFWALTQDLLVVGCSQNGRNQSCRGRGGVDLA